MHINRQEYQNEQSNIIKTLLNYRFFQPWKEYSKYERDENFDKSLITESSLEIFITSTCNQNCSYCYLVNNPQLYPMEYNNKELIFNNLEILLNWIKTNNYYIPQIELYSGEIWHTDFGLDILEKLYKAVQSGLQVSTIVIPSNCSFILNEIQTCKIQRYINNFQKLDVRLCFSISIDGKYIDDFRPLNNYQVKEDIYYENLFLFAEHNNFYFHPMISACNVHLWIDNFIWFEEMFQKYNLNIDTMMTLEVRNNDWTDESIEHYLHFLNFLFEKKFKQFNNSIEFFNYMFNFNTKQYASGYVPYAITFADTFPGCTASDHLTVRLGDMAICPCHRTAYNKFLYGHFIIQNNQIVDIEAINPEIASRILLSNNNLTSIGCDTCIFNKVCLKGCFGSQYETMKDPFFPIENVCKLFKAKYQFLLQKYFSLDIISYLSNISPYNLHYVQAQEFLQFFKEVKPYVDKN